MTTHIHNTGEAFLSADDKRFARVAFTPVQIAHDDRGHLPPAILGAIVTVAAFALTLWAFAV